MIVVRGALCLVMLLPGCAAGTASPAAPPSADPVGAPRATAGAPSAPAAGVALDEVLPAEVGGIELHTFAVGGDMVARLAMELAIDDRDIDVRHASDHGTRFLQMFALRAPGISGRRLLEAWPAVAYPPEVTDGLASQESIGGRMVTKVDAPSEAARIGTFYTYLFGDILLVVQAFDPAVASEALAALP